VVRCYVVTVSDTRTDETDTGGRAIVDLPTPPAIRSGKTIVRDDADCAEHRGASAGECRRDAIITTGGTGIRRATPPTSDCRDLKNSSTGSASCSA
jgi:molybdenum cofactor biosynthesis protein B